MSLARLRSLTIAISMLTPFAASALIISTDVTGDVTWRLSDSPVAIRSLITVERGARLTIEPGVVVKFDSEAGLIVLGDLVARGTARDSIMFTGAEGNSPGSWGGVYLRAADAPAAYDSAGAWTREGSILEYCVIEGGGNPAVEGGSGLGCRTSSPLITRCAIRCNTGETGAIRCLNSAMPLFLNCTIENNRAVRGGAIAVSIGSRPVIRNCRIISNQASDNGGAIYVSLADVTLQDNLIVNNRAGNDGGALFAARANEVTLINNTFIGNSQAGLSGMIYLTDRVKAVIKDNSFDGRGSIIHLKNALLPVEAGDDWWGAAPDGFNFNDAIRDHNDDRNEPAVNYTPPRWAPPDCTPGAPSSVTQIILCRSDTYSDEILRGVADGAPMRIRLTGTDSNPDCADVIPVKIVSALDPKGIVVPLQETGPATGIYTGRGTVAKATNQNRYTIGDLTGGEVTIFNPAFPDVKVIYPTITPKPVITDLAIADTPDLTHLTNHTPCFTWGYFEVVERPQKSFRMTVVHKSGVQVWSSGEVDRGDGTAKYAGRALEDGESYTAALEVWSGKFWSDPVSLNFRMNSLPTAPDIVAPTQNQIVLTRTPKLAAALSIDREGDELTYRVEVMDGDGQVVQQAEGVKVVNGEVSWTPRPLEENGFFQFRWMAADPLEPGPWSEPRAFSVNSIEEPPAAFDLIGPGGGGSEARTTSSGVEEVYDLHPELSWSAAVDPDPHSSVTYTVEIAKGGVWASGRTYADLAAASFRIPDSLDNRTEYHWRITATDNTGRKTVSSHIGKFFVDTTPSVPSITAPLTGREERKPPAKLIWEPSTDPNPADVITYEIEVFQIAGKPLASLTGWISAEVPVSSLMSWESLNDNTVYSWRVRSRDNHNAASNFSEPGQFFFNKTNDAPTAPLAVLSPGDTVMGTTSIRFIWEHGSDADLSDSASTLSYEIEAAVGPIAGDDIRRFRSQPGARELIGELDDNKLWTYRIRTVDDDGAVSPWSPDRKTLVNVREDPPAAFNLIEPADQIRIAELDSLYFAWKPSSDPDWASSVRYRFELTGPDGKIKKIETTQTFLMFRETLVNEAAYHWEVVAIDNTGLETTSTSALGFSTSTTPSAPGAPELPLEILLTGQIIFAPASDPNPRDRLVYTLEIAASSDFGAVLLKKEGVAHNPARIAIGVGDFSGWEKLLDDKDYFIRIRATDNHGFNGAWTTPAKFRYNKENDAPTVPTAPFEPAGNATATDRSPLLKWGASSDEDLSDPASSLVYEIRLDSDGEIEKSAPYEFTTQAGAVEFRVPTPLADNTPWVWAVRARDDGGAVSPWTSVQSFLLNQREDPPTPPIPVKPYNGQSLNILGPIAFAWSRSTDPDYKSSIKYRLTYGKSADMSGAVSVENLTDSSYSVAGPLENTIYYWRIIAVDNTGLETPAQTASFILDTRPTIPQPALPSGGVELKPDGRFAWSGSADPNPLDIITYSMQLSGTKEFTVPAFETSGLKETTITISALLGKTKLLDNARYFWRLKASDNHGIESAWSDAAEFVYNEVNDPPSPFRLLSPAPSGQVPIGSVTFKWEQAFDPDPNSHVIYALEIAKNREFTDSPQRFSGLSAPEMQLPAASFESGATYYWKAAADDGMGGTTFGSNSDRTPWSFTIENPPPVQPESGGTPGK